MSSRVLIGRNRDRDGQASLAAGVVSRVKRTQMASSAPDFTPPGKENRVSRLAKNADHFNVDSADDDANTGSAKAPGRVSSIEDARPESTMSDNTSEELDDGFVAETSTATFGSDDSDGRQSADSLNSGDRGDGSSARSTARPGSDGDGDEDEEYDDDSLAEDSGPSKVIYQDTTTAFSPESISVEMTASTSTLPALRRFCTDNTESAVAADEVTPSRTLRPHRTPVSRCDATMESIAPTDIDESFAVGGVGAMPPITAPSFKSYAGLLSPASADLSGDELQQSPIQPYAGTPSPCKRRSYEGTHAAASSTLEPESDAVYALPKRLASSSSILSCDSSTPQRVMEEEPSSKKMCRSAVKTGTSVSTDSPVAPTAQHTGMMQKIKHLRELVDRDGTLEKQARQALMHCRSKEAGSEQELEAERLLLLAGLRSSRCTSEIERLRQQVAAPIAQIRDASKTSTCHAELVLSDICVPLHLNFLSSIGRESVAHLVVVARCGCDIIATTHVQSSREISGLSGELKFKDQLTLSPVPKNTQLDIELYYLLQGRRASETDQTPGTPRKRRLLGQHGALSKLTTPKKQRGPGSASTPGSAATLTRFTLGASCQVSLDSLEPFLTCKMQEWSSHQLLHGSLDMRVAARPLYAEHQYSAFLTWREEIGGQPNWRRFWCHLDGVVLKAWQYPTDEEAELDMIRHLNLEPLNRGDSSISAGAPSSLVCIRKNSIAINSDSDSQENQRFLFFADSKDDQVKWIAALQQACLDLKTWSALPC